MHCSLSHSSVSLLQASVSQVQASLAHFDDLQQRIPRADIARFETAVRELCFAMLGALGELGWEHAVKEVLLSCADCLKCIWEQCACCALVASQARPAPSYQQTLLPPAERRGATEVERTFCFACGSYR